MTHIEHLMAAFEEAEAQANAIDDLYDEMPDNEEVEAEWIRVTNRWRKLQEAVLNWIVDASNGAIDNKTARAILMGKREEFKELISKGGIS